MRDEREARWARLTALLEPVHRDAATTARRLCGSAADGDDLYHEAVLRAYTRLPSLREEARFRSWFFAVLLSCHRSRARARSWKRWLPWQVAFVRGREPVGEDGSAWGEAGTAAARAARALATLPAEQREAIVLFELDGYAIAEIAEITGASISAVKTRLSRGRERLRAWYERRGFAPAKGDGVETRPSEGRASATGGAEEAGDA